MALVLAATSCRELLTRAHELHPDAKRALVIDWGDWGKEGPAALVQEAVALGWADYYVLRPWQEPDELFHRSVTEFLHEWRRVAPAPARGCVSSPIPLRRARTRFGRCWRATASPRLPRERLGRRPQLARAVRTGGGEATWSSSCTTSGCSRTPTTSSFCAAGASGPTSSLAAASTWSSSAPARPGSLLPSTPRPKGSPASSSIERRSAARRDRARGSGTISASRVASRAPSSRSAPTSSRGSSARRSSWRARSRGCARRRRRAAHAPRPARDHRPDRRALAMGVQYRRLGVPALDELVGRGVFYGASPSDARQYAGRACSWSAEATRPARPPCT